MVLVDENSTAYSMGGFQGTGASLKIYQRLLKHSVQTKVFHGKIMMQSLYQGTERFYRPSYSANLVNSWIPSLDGGKVEEKLKKGGAFVADVGCGHGLTTNMMAKAYPSCRFVGYDNHTPSIQRARQLAKEEGLRDEQIRFEVVSSTNYPSNYKYDLIAFFDCLHDMGDPIGTAAHALKSLKKPDGVVMIVEPFANDKIEDNLNPIGRLFYARFIYVLCAGIISSIIGLHWGHNWRGKNSEVVKVSGFMHFRRATHTPVNLVYEAKA